MEDISVFLPFPLLDPQLFEIEPLPCPCSEPSQPEEYDDFLDNLVDRVDDEASEGSHVETQDNPTKDNKEAEKRKRGRGRPPDKKSLMEKRREANNRERKRMRALVRLKDNLLILSLLY